MISCVSANQECVKDIAASEVLGYLLLAIQLLQNCQLLALESLSSLMSNTKIVKEAMAKGKGWSFHVKFDFLKSQLDFTLFHDAIKEVYKSNHFPAFLF